MKKLIPTLIASVALTGCASAIARTPHPSHGQGIGVVSVAPRFQSRSDSINTQVVGHIPSTATSEGGVRFSWVSHSTDAPMMVIATLNNIRTGLVVGDAYDCIAFPTSYGPGSYDGTWGLGAPNGTYTLRVYFYSRAGYIRHDPDSYVAWDIAKVRIA
jgi:hypothetical protein